MHYANTIGGFSSTSLFFIRKHTVIKTTSFKINVKATNMTMRCQFFDRLTPPNFRSILPWLPTEFPEISHFFINPSPLPPWNLSFFLNLLYIPLGFPTLLHSTPMNFESNKGVTVFFVFHPMFKNLKYTTFL